MTCMSSIQNVIMPSDSETNAVVHMAKTAFDVLGRIITPSSPRSCQLPTSQDEETIGLHQMNTVPHLHNSIPISKARHSHQSLSFSCLGGPLRAVLLIIICFAMLFSVPAFPIHGWSGVYPFLKAIVRKDDSVFGLAYYDTQSNEQPSDQNSDSDTGISNHGTLDTRSTGSMQESTIILTADIIALVFFVVVIAVVGWVLSRKRRSHAARDAQQHPDAQQNDLQASRPQGASNPDGKGGARTDGAQPPRNSSLVQIPTPGSSTFRSLRMSMIPTSTPTRVQRAVTISNPVSVKSTMDWDEPDRYPYPGFGPENLPASASTSPVRNKPNRRSDPAHTILSRNPSGATTFSNATSLRKVAGILKGGVRFSGASYPEDAALSETTHGILSRQASSSSRVSVSTVISPRRDVYRVSLDAPAVPPIPPL